MCNIYIYIYMYLRIEIKEIIFRNHKEAYKHRETIDLGNLYFCFGKHP